LRTSLLRSPIVLPPAGSHFRSIDFHHHSQTFGFHRHVEQVTARFIPSTSPPVGFILAVTDDGSRDDEIDGRDCPRQSALALN
jgi:hypothetical protein